MLELAVLGLLKEQELHGYELKRRIGQLLGPWSAVSFGSLYPALARLERSGAVEVVGKVSPVVPMTGSLGGERAAFRARRATVRAGGRGKKVYRITARGEEQFEAALRGDSGPTDDGRGFTLRLAFARHLPPEGRIRLLERRRAELTRQLEGRADPAEPLDSYARLLVEHGREGLERDIAWIDRLVDAERRPGPRPTAHRPGRTSTTKASRQATRGSS